MTEPQEIAQEVIQEITALRSVLIERRCALETAKARFAELEAEIRHQFPDFFSVSVEIDAVSRECRELESRIRELVGVGVMAAGVNPSDLPQGIGVRWEKQVQVIDHTAAVRWLAENAPAILAVPEKPVLEIAKNTDVPGISIVEVARGTIARTL